MVLDQEFIRPSNKLCSSFFRWEGLGSIKFNLPKGSQLQPSYDELRVVSCWRLLLKFVAITIQHLSKLLLLCDPLNSARPNQNLMSLSKRQRERWNSLGRRSLPNSWTNYCSSASQCSWGGLPPEVFFLIRKKSSPNRSVFGLKFCQIVAWSRRRDLS